MNMSLQKVLFSTTTAAPRRFPRAWQRLTKHGVDALKPTCIAVDEATGVRRWRKPAISRRVAAVLRKQARESGDWDPAWDVELAMSATRGQGRFPHIKVPKKTTRQRTREQRASKIEEKMEGMDDRIEEHLAKRQGDKPPTTFEAVYKRLVKVNKY